MNWLRLDNSAKIYPMLISDTNQNMFRLNAELYETVDIDVLRAALKAILPRFPMLAMSLRKGLFWYFLEENNATPDVYPESAEVLGRLNQDDYNGFNFRVMYYAKRISVDFYHILCDGSGGIEFLKCLLYNYFLLQGKPMAGNSGSIADINLPADKLESEDSFSANYTKTPVRNLDLAALKGDLAYSVEGDYYNSGKEVFTILLDSSKVATYAKTLGCSVTEYLGATIMLACHSDMSESAAHRDNFSLFLPINIRKFYGSKSMRNFSMFARANMDMTGSVTRESCINCIHTALDEGTRKDSIDNKINSTVLPEHILPMRIAPLWLKGLIFKVGNVIFGKAKKSASISNMGVLKFEEFYPYVDYITFQMNTNKLVRLNVTVGSFNNKMAISFCHNIKNGAAPRRFCRLLMADGLDITVNCNDWKED